MCTWHEYPSNMCDVTLVSLCDFACERVCVCVCVCVCDVKLVSLCDVSTYTLVYICKYCRYLQKDIVNIHHCAWRTISSLFNVFGVTSLIHECDMTHPQLWHDSFISVMCIQSSHTSMYFQYLMVNIFFNIRHTLCIYFQYFMVNIYNTYLWACVTCVHTYLRTFICLTQMWVFVT